MTNTKSISELTTAIANARADFGKLVDKRDALNNERDRIVKAVPHTDDIAAMFLNGLKAQTAQCEHQLGLNLAMTYTAHAGFGRAAEICRPGRAADLLSVPVQTTSLQSREISGIQPPAGLNIAVLTYLLRDKIAEEIPALVDRLLPSARNGMKAADRAKALAIIDIEIARLQAEIDDIGGDIQSVRNAVVGDPTPFLRG